MQKKQTQNMEKKTLPMLILLICKIINGSSITKGTMYSLEIRTDEDEFLLFLRAYSLYPSIGKVPEL